VDAGTPHPDWAKVKAAKVGDPVVHGGKIIAAIPGMGKVIDWRSSSWTPVNGGKIRPLLFVDHIPVVHNAPGIADFIRLRDVLVAQGLMVQCSTDGAGNVALFTPLNYLCYQARGANSFSAGCEHMHYLTTDPWTNRQLNAASYVHWRWSKYQAGPNRRASLAAGNGVVRVVRRGYTTHKDVSHYAGYNDRRSRAVVRAALRPCRSRRPVLRQAPVLQGLLMAVDASRVPSKPAAAGVAVPLSTVIVWAAGQFGLEVPPEVATAFAALLIAGAYWAVPARE
jgi:hypothetical protein